MLSPFRTDERQEVRIDDRPARDRRSKIITRRSVPRIVRWNVLDQQTIFPARTVLLRAYPRLASAKKSKDDAPGTAKAGHALLMRPGSHSRHGVRGKAATL